MVDKTTEFSKFNFTHICFLSFQLIIKIIIFNKFIKLNSLVKKIERLQRFSRRQRIYWGSSDRRRFVDVRRDSRLLRTPAQTQLIRPNIAI